MLNNRPGPEIPSFSDKHNQMEGESIIRHSTRPEDLLQTALEEIARDIAIIEPDPSHWTWWMCFFLEQLEINGKKRRLIYNYEKAIASLADKIRIRIQGGRW